MKCPRCGGVLNEYGDLFVCESCGAKFKNKSAQREQKQEEQVVQNTATESVIMPETKNESEKSELELLKERLAEMEKRQSEMESGGSHRNADFKGKFSQIKETKFFGFLKKWGLKVILPCVLAFIVLISLLVSLVGVRGVYYNVNNPNEFYSFSSSKYEYYGDFNGEEYVDKGTWKTKNGKLYLTYKDEGFGKQTDEYYFSKQSNKVIFIGEEKDSLSEFKRVSLSKYKPSSNKKVKITFDANGGSGDTSVSYSFGSKSKEAPQTEREGYFFKGWYKDKYGYKISGSKPYEEGKRVWEDVTYYANWWSDKTYTLTVEGTDIALELEEGDSLLSKLKETEKGYTYDYYIYGELVDENTRMPANSVTISRQQTSVKTIKLTLNAVGGNFNGVGEITKTVAYNSDFTFDVPKSEGMFFAGYVIYPKNSEACISVATHNGSLTNDFWNNVYEDVTLYASWIDLATELADFEYRINDDGICITKYIGKNTVVKIPDSVTSIYDSAFDGCKGLTSVTIGNGVTSIGYFAFFGCSGLTSITIPDSVTSIGRQAFSDCTGLTSVTIGGSVTSIGYYAFRGCDKLQDIYITDIAAWFNISGLDNLMRYGTSNKNLYINNELATSITIPNGVTAIPSYAFSGCTGLTSVTIPDSVTSIGESAFSGCTGLTSVTIPNSVTSIGEKAFYNCTGLTSVTIGNSVTSIGGFAFYGCNNLQDIYITDIATWCNISGLDNLMGDGSSNKNLYINHELVTSITIPNGVTAIPYYAFSKCSSLTSVTIGNSVKSIGEKAFYNCTGLTSVTIGNSVTSIGGFAFYGCNNLQDIYITDIATWCNISGLDNLMGDGSSNKNLYINHELVTSITIPNGVTAIPYYAFSKCSSLTSVTIGNSVKSIGEKAFYNCTGLTSVTIPNSVTSIGDYAFSGCTGLTSVKIGNGVTSIGYYAFWGCSGLTSITIPNSVTSIDYYAFRGCDKLQDIYITDIAAWFNISGLDNLMRYGTSNKNLYINNELATSITIPNGVTAIPSYAFSGCTGLTSVTIGNSVTNIGKDAFYNTAWYNNQPDGLVYAGKVAYKYKGTMPSNTSIVLNEGTLGIADYAFYNCTGLTSVTIPDSVTSVGYAAFQGCTGLTSVTIPNSVTSIGNYAFYNCSGLTSITIPSSVKKIGDSAFSGCKGLMSITFNGTIAQWYAISKGPYWKDGVPSACKVYCTDGTIVIK